MSHLQCAGAALGVEGLAWCHTGGYRIKEGFARQNLDFKAKGLESGKAWSLGHMDMEIGTMLQLL